MRTVLLIVAALVQSGCAAVLCEIGLPGCTEARCEEMFEKRIPYWNSFLGKHKDEWIKVAGPPNRCASLSDGGETCECRREGISGGGAVVGNGAGGIVGESSIQSNWAQRLFTYDRNDIARSWHVNSSMCPSWSSASSQPRPENKIGTD